MSPRRRRTTEEDVEATRAARLPGMEVPPVAATPLVPTLVEDRDDAELDAVLEQLGNDGRVKVWNIVEGKGVYAGEMSMEGFTLDLLMDTYGGGDKTVAFYQANRRVRSVRVSLDPLVPVRNPRIKSAPPGAPAPAPAQPFDAAAAMLAGMGAIMKASADNSTMMIGMMAEIAKSRPVERDPLEIVKAVAEMMKQNAPSSPVAASTNSARELFEVFEKGMSVASKLGGNGEEGDGTTTIIREGIGAVGRMAEAIIVSRGQNGNGAAPVAEVPALPDASLELPGPASAPSTAAIRPPGSAVTSSPPSMAQPIQPTRPWHRAVVAHYDDLKLAARFMSGDTAAVELLRRIPEPAPGEDDVLDDLMDDLEATGFIERTRLAFPELALSPEWVAQFHETLKANMVEEEDTTARENGVDATNPSLTRPSLTG